MKEKMVSLTAAVLRNVFPKECASVGDGQLYRLLSEDVVFTPSDGLPFDQHTVMEILKLAAAFVPLIVAALKALKPEERQSSKEAEERVLIVIFRMPDATKLQERSPLALERLVSRCVDVALKNWDKL